MQITRDPSLYYFWTDHVNQGKKGHRLAHSSHAWLTQCDAHISPHMTFTIASPGAMTLAGVQGSPACISPLKDSVLLIQSNRNTHIAHMFSSCFIVSVEDKAAQGKKDRAHLPGKHRHMTHAHKQDWFFSPGLGFLNCRLYLIYLTELK